MSENFLRMCESTEVSKKCQGSCRNELPFLLHLKGTTSLVNPVRSFVLGSLNMHGNAQWFQDHINPIQHFTNKLLNQHAKPLSLRIII